jgi:hypothetical protein
VTTSRRWTGDPKRGALLARSWPASTRPSSRRCRCGRPTFSKAVLAHAPSRVRCTQLEEVSHSEPNRHSGVRSPKRKVRSRRGLPLGLPTLHAQNRSLLRPPVRSRRLSARLAADGCTPRAVALSAKTPQGNIPDVSQAEFPFSLLDRTNPASTPVSASSANGVPVEKLSVTKGSLGPLGEGTELEVRPLTVLVGRQGTGKSLAAQVLYFFRDLPFLVSYDDAVHRRDLSVRLEAGAETVVRSVLDGLRSRQRTFATFASPSASLQWNGRFLGKPRTLGIHLL